jgi:hypothetical protein
MSTLRKIRSNDKRNNVVKKDEELPYETLYPFYENVYYINSNGVVPFRVTVNDNCVYIEKNNFNSEALPSWKKLRKIKFKKIFIGSDNESHKGNVKYFGNTLLLQITSQKYIFIGSEIFEFKSKEPIYIFESPLDYPYAYTKDKTFLIWDKTYFPTLPGKDPAEAEFIHEKENKDSIKNIDIKMIYEKDY